MKGNHENTSAGTKRKGGWIVALTVCGLLLVILVGVAVFRLNREEEESPGALQSSVVNSVPHGIGQGTLAGDPEGSVQPDMSVGAGYFEARMDSTRWTFDRATRTCDDLYVANSENNMYNMYFKIIINKTEQEIYTSPILEIGEELTEVTLDADLEPGEYVCTMEHHLLDPETNQEVDGLDLYLEVIVKDAEVR